MSDSCDWNLTAPTGPQHVGFYVDFQTNNGGGPACWLWSIWKEGHRKAQGSAVRYADAWDAAGKKVAELLKAEPLPPYMKERAKERATDAELAKRIAAYIEDFNPSADYHVEALTRIINEGRS